MHRPPPAAPRPAGMGRVFIALWPPAAVAEEIVQRTGALVTAQGGRAAAAVDLHLTLAFLGALGDAQLAAAAAALDRCRSRRFEVDLDRLGCFRGAGVVWLGPSRAPARLGALHAALWHELAAAGFEPERRAFKPHVTLARRARPMRAQPLKPPIRWCAEALALATSTPGAGGPPRYRRLAARTLERAGEAASE